MLNTIGLRANPTIIKSPQVVDNFPSFGKQYDNAKHAWRFVFDIEYGAHSIELLKEDFNLIPFISNLNEDCIFGVNLFDTFDKDKCNIVFNELDK